MLIAKTYGVFMYLNRYKKLVWLLILAFNLTYASTNNDTVKSNYNNIDPLITKQIQSAISSIEQQLTIDYIETSPVSNLYTVMLNNGHPIYSNADGSYIITGAMLQIKNSNVINLTENIIARHVASKLSKLNIEELICYKPKNIAKGVIYVFTDVNCFYCKKFHQDITKLNELQIEVRLLAFPRNKKATNEFNYLVDIWSSINPKMALDKAMIATKIESTNATKNSKALNIVEQQQALGLQLGITGTPSIILENGEIISGYVKPEVIAQKLNIYPPQKNMQNSVLNKSVL